MTRRRREARFERGGVDERLERGARLTVRLDRAIEVALVEVAAADHRPHVAGAGSSATSAACSGVDGRSQAPPACASSAAPPRAVGLPASRGVLDRRRSARRSPLRRRCCIGMSIVENTRSPP